MKDLKYKIILERFGNYINNINSSIVKEEYKKNLAETKSILDKDYLLAYYDIRFNVPNQNKLLRNLKKIQKENQKKRYNLLFIHLEGLNHKYYSVEKKNVVENIRKIEKQFEKTVFFSDSSIIDNEFYIFNDCLVFLVKNDRIRKFYKTAKNIMISQNYFNWKIYFEELEKKQTKALKAFETCYLKTLKKINDNITDEKINQLEQRR